MPALRKQDLPFPGSSNAPIESQDTADIPCDEWHFSRRYGRGERRYDFGGRHYPPIVSRTGLEAEKHPVKENAWPPRVVEWAPSLDLAEESRHDRLAAIEMAAIPYPPRRISRFNDEQKARKFLTRLARETIAKKDAQTPWEVEWFESWKTAAKYRTLLSVEDTLVNDLVVSNTFRIMSPTSTPRKPPYTKRRNWFWDMPSVESEWNVEPFSYSGSTHKLLAGVDAALSKLIEEAVDTSESEDTVEVDEDYVEVAAGPSVACSVENDWELLELL
ncbi:hypothetical protein HO133_000486 [Letharia lupina]|uniref:Uncharacterized protein n=1 Tax=Letharia lupina TaxID=560253 RepID=A0A8H6CHQ8_9LECA|nr:uncharacterized protein HO133_000486 [Letharia lupina]KAF6223643.1 hypothetical protein HO133_000486 [Letharia lupina]